MSNTPEKALYASGTAGRWTKERTERAWLKNDTAIANQPDEKFRHPAEIIDAENGRGEDDGGDAVTVAAELLLRIIVWINRAATPERRGHRVWVVTYHLKPELSAIQTGNAYAKAIGVKRQAVHDLVTDFRKEFAEVNWPSKVSGNGRRKGAALAASSPTPGKESPVAKVL